MGQLADNPAARGEACCVCGSAEAHPWRTAVDNLLEGTQTFTAVRCVRCGLARLQPRPPVSEMGRYYAAGTYARAEDDTSELAHRLDGFFAHQADRLLDALTPEQKAAGQRHLDVGCGDGRFLAAMAAHGWLSEGLETDPVAADLARRRAACIVHEVPLEDAHLPGGAYALVSLLHVLEHVPDPRATIAEAFRLLQPGGVLLLALPNAGSAEAALLGAYWYPLDLPRHYWGFTPRTLTRLVEECGFRAPRLRYLPLMFVPQGLRYVLRRLRGRTAKDGATAATSEPRVEATSKANGGKARTRAFLGLLSFSERLGRTVPGEVMELTATRPAEGGAAR